MATGDITATDEGTFVVGSTEMLTELNTLNVGAATAGTETATIIVVPNGNVYSFVTRGNIGLSLSHELVVASAISIET